MKKLHLALFFLLVAITASSQKVYFVYIQTESDQPFYVKMNEKISSSTASGYIILPRLLDSSYNFSIGFPQNKWPEQNFSITINTKDHGFLLKNFGEKGWGLFDLQKLTIQMSISGKASINKKPEIENNTVSVFTEMLSRAANDPSLMEKPIKRIEDKKIETAVQRVIIKEESSIDEKEMVVAKKDDIAHLPAVKNEETKTDLKEISFKDTIQPSDQSIAKKEENFTEEKKKDIAKSVAPDEKTVVRNEENNKVSIDQSISSSEKVESSGIESYKSSQVKKWSESSTTEGFGLVFIDVNGNEPNDTIRLIIPNPKVIFGMSNVESPEGKKSIAAGSDSKLKEDLSVIGNQNAELKNNCVEIASDNDFYVLRKNMAAVLSDEEMIAEAKKYFKTKCFTSAQVKNLSTLFLNDEGKYKFFDVSYKYVSDAESFTSLQSEFKDEYFAGRFKAMIRN